MEKKYVLEVQLTPQIHKGEMSYYWHIDLHDKESQYSVFDGFAKDPLKATRDAIELAHHRGIIVS